VGRTQDY